MPTGQQFSVLTGSPMNTVVGTVSASDPNIFQVPPGVLSYSFQSFTTDGLINAQPFAIDPSTGQIRVINPDIITVANTVTFTEMVQVADNSSPSLTTLVPVTIIVTNVPLTVGINGVPSSSPEGTRINLDTAGTVTDLSGQTVSYFWSVTHGEGALKSEINTPTDGPAFSFTPFNAGTYTVSVTVTDTRGATTTATAIIKVTNVPATLDFGSTSSFSEPGLPFTRTISFTAPGANTYSVAVDYGDGTKENFALTPGEHGFDPSSNTFTLQHSYNAVATFLVTVSIIDSEGGISTATFAVAVYDPKEFASIIAFAIGIADSSGTAHVDLAHTIPGGSATLAGVLTGGVKGDSLAFTLYNSDPTEDHADDLGLPAGTIPVDLGGPDATLAN